MRLPRRLKVFCAVMMSILLTQLPTSVLAEVVMIPTLEVAAELSRERAQEQVLGYLNEGHVRDQLIQNGVAPEEASARLASLSDQELRQLATQVQEARAGGDILVTILLVVLIVFLVKRI